MFLAMGFFEKMLDQVRREIASQRRAPRPGLIGDLVRAEADGDKLDEPELLSMIILLLIAGFETTTHLISDSVIALETHPDQKAWLMADPAGRIERAVEELARWNSPVQSTKPRYVARDTDFFGQHLKRGELILALVGAANADPAEFEAPEALRLDRFPNPHLVFSSGIHFCLGQQLARVETQVALERLYARFPNLALAEPRSPGSSAWACAASENPAFEAERAGRAPGGLGPPRWRPGPGFPLSSNTDAGRRLTRSARVRDTMRRWILIAGAAALLAGCRDGTKEAEERANRAMAMVAELQQQVADLKLEVADLDDHVDAIAPDDGVDDDPDRPTYASASSPARAFAIKARVRSRPKIATKEPKRGPWL